VRDYLTAEHSKGLAAVILCPIGFVTDHVEVLYDLDTEVAALCQNLQLPMVRARTANDHPVFINMMTDVVLSAFARYEHGVPLPIASETASSHSAK
jgi:ferrochelatase